MRFRKNIFKVKIRPNNKFGRILHLISRYFAIFLIIIFFVKLFSVFPTLIISAPLSFLFVSIALTEFSEFNKIIEEHIKENY